jgi:hypothetical protein
MTPGEVHGLQALAMKHGGSLTINPDTGLPEAGFLKSLLPMIAGFALAPLTAGTSLAFLGASPMAAAMTVGGVTGLATGSLKKGLLAGLGAYGGAGLQAGMSELGAAELAKEHIGTKIPAYMGDPSAYATEVNAVRDSYLNAAKTNAFTPMEKLSAGLSSATASPTDALAFAKQNMMPLAAAAAAPIMAMEPTTQMPSNPSGPSYIRQKVWNGRGYDEVGPVEASKFGGNSFSDIYRGYNGGGIVALADGGGWDYSKFDPANYAGKGTVSTQAQVDAARAAQEADNARQRTVTAQRVVAPEQEAAVLNALRIGQGLNTNTGVDANAGAGTNAGTGITQLNANTLTNANADTSKPPAGETQAARDARLFTAAGGDWNKAATMRTAEDTALVADPNYWTNKAGLAALDPGASYTTKWFAERGLGFDPIDQVIDNFLVKYKPELDAMLPKDQEAAMRAALAKEKLNEADVIKATGKTIAQLAAAKRADGSIIVPGKLDEVPVGSLPGGVSGAGNTVVNANGTITTSPDIPRPESGSFAGMKDVRDVFTKGGGDLGFKSKTFDKIEDFNKAYVTDRMSGDSLAAYEYLSGKKGATYPTKSTVSQIAKPYDEAVLGYPAAGNKKYNFVDGKYKLNPDYVAPIRDSSGKVSYAPSLNEIKSTITRDNLTGQALYDWAIKNNVSAQAVADATGRDLSSVLADFRKGTAYTKAVTTDGKVDEAKVETQIKDNWDEAAYLAAHPTVAEELRTGKSVSGQPTQFTSGYEHFTMYGKNAGWKPTTKAAGGGMMGYAMGGYAVGGGLGSLGSYSDGGRLLKGPGDGVSDSIPATIGAKQQPARLADGEFVVPARIVSELGNGSTEAGAKKLYAMMDRVQRARGKTTGKNKVAANSRADKYLPA